MFLCVNINGLYCVWLFSKVRAFPNTDFPLCVCVISVTGGDNNYAYSTWNRERERESERSGEEWSTSSDPLEYPGYWEYEIHIQISKHSKYNRKGESIINNGYFNCFVMCFFLFDEVLAQFLIYPVLPYLFFNLTNKRWYSDLCFLFIFIHFFGLIYDSNITIRIELWIDQNIAQNQ